MLSNIPKPAAESTGTTIDQLRVGCSTPDQATLPQTPVTPVLAEAVAALHDLIKQDAHMLDESSRQRLQRHLQKLTNATHLSFAERALLSEHNQFLAKINNEAKVRRATKSKVLGTARIMSYEDLENARAERAVKEAASEARKAKKARKAADATPETEKANAGKKTRGRKHKSSAEADTPQPEAKIGQTSLTQAREGEIASVP